MGVNGGAGNTISFSELQTYYGGTDPISLSEYYRGGDEVPGSSTTTTTQSVNATTAGGGSGTSNHGYAAPYTITYPANTAVNVSLSFSYNGSGTMTIGSSSFSPRSNNFGLFWYVSAGSGLSCSGSPASAIVNTSNPTRQNSSFAARGDQNFIVTSGGVDSNTLTISGTTGSSGCTISMTLLDSINDSTSEHTFTTGNVGISGTQTVTTTVDANTNVPASGTINIDVFNAPGSPAQ